MTMDGTPASAAAPLRAAYSASEKVVRAIIRGLYEGNFVPGQRLVEPDLMTMSGASRSTVREAIRRLEADGIVEVLPYRGAQIRRLSPREARDALLVIEYCIGLAARLAAERIGEGDNRSRFESAADELLRHAGDGESFEQVRARDRFYRVLTSVSGNAELVRIIPTLQVHLLRNRYSLSPTERFADYRAIAAGILGGQGEAAEAAARDHIRKTGHSIADAERRNEEVRRGG